MVWNNIYICKWTAKLLSIWFFHNPQAYIQVLHYQTTKLFIEIPNSLGDNTVDNKFSTKKDTKFFSRRLKILTIALSLCACGASGGEDAGKNSLSDGLYVKRNSLFEITFVITSNSGCISSAAAYDYRSYEAVTGYFQKALPKSWLRNM